MRQRVAGWVWVVAGVLQATVPIEARAQALDSLLLATHVRVLAADSMEGRSNGSRGQRAAADYIIAQFRRMGLAPAFAGGRFTQDIPLRRVVMARDSAKLVLDTPSGRATVPGNDFHHFAGDTAAFQPFSGTIERIGPLGSSTVNVRGKVVVARPSPTVRLDSGSALLEAQGARALIVIAPDSARYTDLRNARGQYRYAVDARIGGAADRRMPVIIASPRAGALLDQATTLRGEWSVRFVPVTAWNVAARLDGTRSPGRAVIFSAHYDHIGYARPANGDSLYNGFMDNAVGVAAVLGIAESMQREASRPTGIFLLTAVEEEGSYGAAYFAEHPPLPLDSITAVINLDAGAPLAVPASWYVEGGSHPLIASAMLEVGKRGVKTEPAPLNPYSDHWPFHVRGVPVAFPVSGDDWLGLSEEQERAAIARWWRQHRPNDEWSADFPLSGLKAYADFAMILGLAIADVAGSMKTLRTQRTPRILSDPGVLGVPMLFGR